MLNLDEIVMVEYKGSIKEYKRSEALKTYKYAINNSQGLEKQRYMDIFVQLVQGNRSCTDTIPWR